MKQHSAGYRACAALVLLAMRMTIAMPAGDAEPPHRMHKRQSELCQSRRYVGCNQLTNLAAGKSYTWTPAFTWATRPFTIANLTMADRNPWFYYDLGSAMAVCGVAIVGSSTIGDIEVRVGNSNARTPDEYFFNPVCAFRDGPLPGEAVTEFIPCTTNLVGRYVSVQLMGTPTLYISGKLDIEVRAPF